LININVTQVTLVHSL